MDKNLIAVLEEFKEKIEQLEARLRRVEGACRMIADKDLVEEMTEEALTYDPKSNFLWDIRRTMELEGCVSENQLRAVARTIHRYDEPTAKTYMARIAEVLGVPA